MDKKILDQQIITLFNSPFTKNKGFNLLVDSYKQTLYFQIRRILISHESTNDVLQEVFIKCWNKLDSFNQQSKLSTWLYRIAYNESLQWMRKNDKHNSYSLDEINQNHTPSTSIFAKNADEISLILEKAIRLRLNNFIFNLKKILLISRFFPCLSLKITLDLIFSVI